MNSQLFIVMLKTATVQGTVTVMAVWFALKSAHQAARDQILGDACGQAAQS